MVKTYIYMYIKKNLNLPLLSVVLAGWADYAPACIFAKSDLISTGVHSSLSNESQVYRFIRFHLYLSCDICCSLFTLNMYESV